MHSTGTGTCLLSTWYKTANRGPKNTYFPRLRNSTATLTAYIFGMKHDIHNRANALETTRGLLHSAKTSWTLVHKRLKIGPEFLPTLCKFCILPQLKYMSACRLSVTFVRPTQAVETFSNISSPLCSLAIMWPLCKSLQRSSQGKPSVGGVKRKRGSKIEHWWTYRRLYLINDTGYVLGYK